MIRVVFICVSLSRLVSFAPCLVCACPHTALPPCPPRIRLCADNGVAGLKSALALITDAEYLRTAAASQKAPFQTPAFPGTTGRADHRDMFHLRVKWAPGADYYIFEMVGTNWSLVTDFI